MDNRVYIFDTTLRDGEQVPGCQLNTSEKIEAALALEELGVDIIEAGFPISSPGDFKSVVEISKVIKKATICGLSRAIEKDIDAAGEALKGAKFPRIHTGLGASDIHIENKLRSTREDVLKQAIKAVRHAKKWVDDVEFYAEDAGRADLDYLCKMVEAVIQAGATVVNIPDTTGFNLPWVFGEKIRYLMDHVPNVNQAIISVHCHNDLGLATANTVAGLANGARQAELTINGIGERAGNTSLEEVVMTLKCHPELGLETNIDTTKLYPMSKMITRLMNMPVQANKAIVGKNAFSHSSGIHQDGFLKYKKNYEIIDPSEVGADASSIVLTARSGRAALKHRLGNLGYILQQEDLDTVYESFLTLADRQKHIEDQDLENLVNEVIVKN